MIYVWMNEKLFCRKFFSQHCISETKNCEKFSHDILLQDGTIVLKILVRMERNLMLQFEWWFERLKSHSHVDITLFIISMSDVGIIAVVIMHKFLFETMTALVFTLKYEDSYYRRRNVIKTRVRYSTIEERGWATYL